MEGDQKKLRRERRRLEKHLTELRARSAALEEKLEEHGAVRTFTAAPSNKRRNANQQALRSAADEYEREADRLWELLDRLGLDPNAAPAPRCANART